MVHINGRYKKIFRTATFHVLLQRHKFILSVQILKVQQVLNVLLIFLFYKSNVDIKFLNFQLVNMIPVVGHADDRYLFFVEDNMSFSKVYVFSN